MADNQHLRILKRGVDSWNVWRKRAGEAPDLAEAELADADLGRINLDDRRLAGADLDGADLSGANLEAACLSEAQLFEADLRQARLAGAQLDAADLAAANLQLCDLEDADLRGANLRGADLRASHLEATHLGGADLTGTYLHSARLRATLLVDLDLSRAKGLPAAKHLGPSSVGTDTLARTAAALAPQKPRLRRGLRPCPSSPGADAPAPEFETAAGISSHLADVEAFLRGAGVEQHLIEHYRGRCGAAAGLAPCYVVHHPADRGLASVLHDELQARGVTCWLAPGGRGTPTAQAARAHGIKVVLCVTRPALKSLWARDQVADVVREVLSVVDFDGCLTGGWGGAGADRLRELLVADFSRLVSDEASLEEEVAKVVSALHRKEQG